MGSLLLQLSLPIYLKYHGKDENVIEKLRDIQHRDDGVASAEFCKLFDSFDRNGDLAKICKEMYLSKVVYITIILLIT